MVSKAANMPALIFMLPCYIFHPEQKYKANCVKSLKSCKTREHNIVVFAQRLVDPGSLAPLSLLFYHRGPEFQQLLPKHSADCYVSFHGSASHEWSQHALGDTSQYLPPRQPDPVEIWASPQSDSISVTIIASSFPDIIREF